jgi:NAD(P)-dependent dehydrogenase (short-subunit alcohol dehydrogenase family)
MKKIALITGAGSGVGRHTAVAMSRAGFDLVLSGRRREPLEETSALLDRGDIPPLVVPTDVREVEQVERLFGQVADQRGRLDVLFNNAGVNVPPQPLETLSPGQWQLVLDVNVTGAFLCTQAAFRLMKSQDPPGGRIINNGSVSSQVPRPHAVAYNAAKHAVTGLTRSTALEGRKYAIACGQIDIGNALTDMAAKLQQGALQADGSLAVEPMMRVEDVAAAVVYMATLPLEANVLSMTVMATGMPLVGRG